MKYIVFACTIWLVACGTTPMLYQRTGEVNAVHHEQSIVVVSSQARAENPGKASSFAERNAFENLLFKGIPNSNQESPMIANESKAKKEHPVFFEDLLINRGYTRYIMDSHVDNSLKSGGVFLVDQIVKIDLHALRDHLKNEGITRSFGL